MVSEQFKYINLVNRLQVEPNGMCGCSEQEAVSGKENNWFPGNPSVPCCYIKENHISFVQFIYISVYITCKMIKFVPW